MMYAKGYYMLYSTARGRDGKITQSTDYEFLNDRAYWKVTAHAYGQCNDETDSLVIDTTNLEYTDAIAVRDVSAVSP